VSAVAALSVGGTPLADVQLHEASNPLLEASPGLMIWTLVCFGITLWILKRYVFGPLSAAIERPRSREEAVKLLEEYKARLAEARKEADELRERGRREGERQRSELLSRAEQERDRVVADQEALLEAQSRQAITGIRDEVAELALLAAEKVTRKSLTDADHRRLIEEALREADLSALRDGAGGNGNGAGPA
jgi:F-type H+-transporting ATPase subunit b